ncbi:hypothetical protein [Dyella choica]|uniref:Uncharacterized protein n=1 Tax=Dyella choica TaxID=1927959 RepID=A0A3S0SA43_9GAMM|nr:hypothetical protein [Dyella choica]RUL75932.1 hypothetical protein EKH80_09400 [Dyella choica]
MASAAAQTNAGGLAPWRFEMTPQEVVAFQDYGPYKSFSNGDLETYAGVFNGHKENVQFFFKEGKLARIGIYLYEGQDIKAAAATWGRAYASLKSMYGRIELPDIHVSGSSSELAPDAVAAAGGANVDVAGRSQMAPIKQPSDKFVFASFRRQNVQGRLFYYVIVYCEPPRG